HTTDAADITAARGNSVCLPCASDLYSTSTVTVTWRKNGRPGILCQYRVLNGKATDTISESCDDRINRTAQPPTLCISGVKTRDAGYYNCSVSRVVPPPTVESFYQVELHVEGPPRVIIESQTSNTSDCLWLLCELDGLDSAQVNITWSRNGQSISETTSSLQLCNHEWSEGDTFTCNTSQFSSYTDLSASITITQKHSRVDVSKYSVIIICGGALTGTLVLIFLVICIYKFIQNEKASRETQWILASIERHQL
ncbi:hypothetical protein ANANG_G00155440, partial [Anguilla anguilla]